MTWVLTVMLYFPSVEPYSQNWQHRVFETQELCHEYVHEHKVDIVDTVLKQFREENGSKLYSFDFYCVGVTEI